MKYFLPFLLLWLASIGVWAQPAGNRGEAFSQIASEQRRAELRLMLKTPGGREAQERLPPLEEKLAERHLSAQERENLRQQLRSQRRDARAD